MKIGFEGIWYNLDQFTFTICENDILHSCVKFGDLYIKKNLIKRWGGG